MSTVKSNNTIIINDLNRETIDLSILSNALKQYDEEHHDNLITSSSQHSSFTSITTADNTSNSSLLSSTSSTHNSSNSNISTNSSNINYNTNNNKITLSPLISPELQTKEERRKSKSFTFFKSKTSSPIKSSNNNKLNEKNISPPSPTTKKGNSNVAAALLLENNKKKRSESNNSSNESNNNSTTTTTTNNTTTSNNNVNIKIPVLNLGNALTSNTTSNNGNGTPKLNLLSINSSRVVGSSDHHTNVSVLATPRGEKQPITKSKSTFFFQRRKSLSSINNSPTGTTINTSINGSNGNNNENVPPPPTNIIPIKQIKKNYLKQQQLDNNSINSNNNNIINIDMNILNQLMISNTGYSILQTSMKHVILLIFIKYLGCQQCQKILNDLQFYLSRFLTCNIIPVICHQEDYDKANDYLNNSLDIYSNNTIFGNKEMLNLLHCQVTSDIIENFNLKKEKFSLNQVPNKIKSIFKENKLKKPKEMKIYKLGMFLVEFGNVKKYFIESKNSNKPNILNIILELNKNKEMDKFFPDLLKIYPNLEMFIRKERNSISLSGNYLQNTLQNTSTTIDTLQNNEITLNKVIENIKYRNYFKVFLASEFSSELILFIEQVEMYQMIYRMEEKRKEELNDFFSDLIDSTIIEDFNSNNSNNTINRNVETERKANYILKHFLTFDAMFQINTNQKRILNIENTIKERGYTFNLFDDVIHDITSTMLKYSFNRFRETDLYKEMLQKINDGTL